MKNIVLTGFMGSGKSTVSKILSKKLNMELFESDEIIETRVDKKISEIFEINGEKYFRDLETEVIEYLSSLDSIIISTGGGVITQTINIENLKKNGAIFFLDVSIDAIKERLLGDSTRPLIVVEDRSEMLERLHKERLPLYIESADYIISVDDSNEAATEICDIVQKINGGIA